MNETPKPDLVVDARGHRCPVPSLRLRRALELAAESAVVELLADDPLARIDIPHLLSTLGYPLLKQESEGGVLRFVVRKAAWSEPV
ncbi:sulfurtransferase TusA family protein [Phenylobacterium montanum]|uniref:Sulfurtransferase TusA family protein n=1 Tax=Phenylobacterium montanum TaxID=2823693 RepID=A0A975IVD5_9CAUL|nr:sulfurtransferase TusA family protein [Caulobacter sp. S6]QUD88892.1 sulfurtransferase TusA family protein [Caulobacter sp. S6]